MVKRSVGFLLVLTALIPVAEASASHATDRADARLDRALAGLVKQELGPPGAIAVVQRGDQLKTHAAGLADVKALVKPREGLRMRIASTAKAFSGAAALGLVSRGKLSLDDTIGSRLAAQVLPAAWSRVTLRQLLNHTSGVPDFSEAEDFRALLQRDPHQRFDSRRLWAFVADRPLGFAPGTRYKYSNTDNIIVALMAEAATGKRYEDAPRRATSTSRSS